MGYCLVFPGQGSQFPGMARGLDVRGLVDEELGELMERGPADTLDRTVHAQPAVVAVSVLLWQGTGLETPDCVLGHSLGEYTALVAAGSLDGKDAVSLVKARARFMESSRADTSGGMAAVVGLAVRDVEDVCAVFDDLWVANLNGRSQVVISGARSSIEKAAPMLKERGALRVVPLKVSVASHCPFMEKAGLMLASHLAGIRLGAPSCPVISNVTARPENDPGRIKELLAAQLTRPVRFEESVRTACDLGADRFVEIGPRSVLAPLIRRIVPGVGVEAVTVAQAD